MTLLFQLQESDLGAKAEKQEHKFGANSLSEECEARLDCGLKRRNGHCRYRLTI